MCKHFHKHARILKSQTTCFGSGYEVDKANRSRMRYLGRKVAEITTWKMTMKMIADINNNPMMIDRTNETLRIGMKNLDVAAFSPNVMETFNFS